jgi:hypothetical protein
MSFFDRPTIEQMAAKKDVSGLIKTLKRDGYLRRIAADALVEIGAPSVEPLIATLKDQDKDVRCIAAEALDKLEWQPGKDANGAAYWVVKGEFGECIAIGAPSVEPLLRGLRDNEVDGFACYRALEQIPGCVIPSNDERRFLKQILGYIEGLYSRIRAYEGSESETGALRGGFVREDSLWRAALLDEARACEYQSDIDNLRSFMQRIPKSLIESVRALSDVDERFFQDDPLA